MRRFATLLLVLAIVVGSFGYKKERKAYLDQYKAHTEKLVIDQGFATAMFMEVTLLTPTFRAALASERQRLMEPTTDNHAEFVERMERDGEAYFEVVFSAESSVANADKFGTNDATWNLRLTADGTSQPLVAIEHIRKPTPVHHGLYPHINQWNELWIARFERVTITPQTVELHVGSGYGNGSVDWTPR